MNPQFQKQRMIKNKNKSKQVKKIFYNSRYIFTEDNLHAR